ncbi:5063_t:CDS:2, partial [Cetraspora pellucida]
GKKESASQDRKRDGKRNENQWIVQKDESGRYPHFNGGQKVNKQQSRQYQINTHKPGQAIEVNNLRPPQSIGKKDIKVESIHLLLPNQELKN